MMKRLIAVPCDISVRKALLALCAVAASSISSIAYAEDRTISKTSKPGVIVVLSNGGTGLSFFNLLSTDFPSGTTTLPKKLLGVEWSTTYYPEAIGERVELCYFRPYNSVEANCREISKGSSGTQLDFNDLPFGNGAGITIRHHVEAGGVQIANAAGNDTVTYRYSY